MRTSWILLGTGVPPEVLGTTCMKLSAGLSRPVPAVLMFLFYALSLTALTVALRDLEMTVAYAIWSALGSVSGSPTVGAAP
jgi:small multidrug resistance pump